MATPLARLKKMNPPAIELYRSHGIDLAREPLEIAVCAQHNNGGFRGSIWWQSNLRGLFPVGEACGTHGVTRPGGAALNAGQVGSARAALFIARRRSGPPLSGPAFRRAAGPLVLAKWALAGAMLERGTAPGLTPETCLAEVKRRMSACGAIVRDPDRVRVEKDQARELWLKARRAMGLASARDLPLGFKTLDLALTHAVYLEAIGEYLERGGKSRGSSLVPDAAGRPPHPLLGRRWAFSLAGPGDFTAAHILEVRLDGRGRLQKAWVPVRPVPRPEGWFESVWADYRNDRIVVEEE
jgi:succinate dehydrogenase/fumarate reductase flavoprotein subunit